MAPPIFPNNLWDGKSLERANILVHRPPGPEDWNQIVAEVMALEQYALYLKNLINDLSGGGSATPGGSSGQIQFNNNGSLGGLNGIAGTIDSVAIGIVSQALGQQSLAIGNGCIASTDQSISLGQGSIAGDSLLACTIDGITVTILNGDYTGWFRDNGPESLVLSNLSGGTGPTILYTQVDTVTYDDTNTIIILVSNTTTHTTGYVNLRDNNICCLSFGYQCVSSGYNSYSEGYQTEADGSYSHAEGYQTIASGSSSHAEGYQTEARGSSSHAEGFNSYAPGNYSHAEGFYTVTGGNSAHAEGFSSYASGNYSHAEGFSSYASGNYSHAEGSNTFASGESSHTEGFSNYASNTYSHAEGSNCQATGVSSHAEGSNCQATGIGSHVEGSNCQATGVGSHAEGVTTTATGRSSHAEGSNTSATGHYSHAEGRDTVASGQASHAGGWGATSSLLSQWACSDGPTINGQASQVYASNRTIDSNPVHLFINASDNIVITGNRAFSFLIQITAYKTDGSKTAAFWRQGLIKNISGTVTIVGSINTIGTDVNSNGWSVLITADTGNNSLSITVTGENTVDWQAKIDFVEVG